jgi:excisionase family DNA binding protein
MTQTDLIGSTEAARLLGKSPRTIHRMVDAGTLTPAMTAPGGRVGVYLFRRDDVEALLVERAAS